MIDFSYLSKGLNALARAHQMSSMAGHLGAAVVAGYFVGEKRLDLDPGAVNGIEDDLERIIRGESVFGRKMSRKSSLTDSELFEPFAREKPDESLVDAIAESLSKSLNQPRQSGHNVIFGSIAIRALREHPDFATPSLVAGICKLMALFENAHPGSGYYGKAKGRIRGNQIKLPEDDATPEYHDLEGMAVTVMNVLIAQKADDHRQGYGGLVHIINHAAAIADLADYGYGELVPEAIQAHRHHLRLWNNLPNLADELGPVKVSEFTPDRAAYWSSGEVPYDRALLTHRVKTMFGFGELAATIDDDDRERVAYDKMRYLM